MSLSGMISQRGVRLLAIATVLISSFWLLLLPVHAQEPPPELLHSTNPTPPGQQFPLASAPISVTQSVSFEIEVGNTVACSSNQGGYSTQNSYWRVFDLNGQYGITEPFTVQNVVFGVETNNGIFDVSVRVYRLAGDFTTENLVLLSQATVQLDSANAGTLLSVDVPPASIIPQSHDLVIEIDVPSGQSQVAIFYPASNALGQSAPTYLSAGACGFNQPTDYNAIGYPDMHLVMVVNGDTDLPTAVTLNEFAVRGGTWLPVVAFAGTAIALSGAAWYVFRRSIAPR